MKKKILLLLMAVAICGVAALAQTFTEGNFNYTVITSDTYGTYASLGSPTTAFLNSNPTSVSIPGFVTYNGQKLRVSISLRALGDYSNKLQNVTSIWLSYGVFDIGYRAFCNLHKLQKVHIPSSVINISREFLYNCGDNASGSTLTINWGTLNPNSTYIYDDSFSGCLASYRKVNMPTYPAVTAANNIYNLTRYFSVNSTPYPSQAADYWFSDGCYVVTTPTTASSNGELTLVGIENAPTSFSITSSTGYTDNSYGKYYYVASVAQQACAGNNTLQSLSITKTNFTINREAFYGCTALTSANLSCSQILERSFYGCTSLSTVNLNEGVKYVASQAFYNAAFSTLNIPATLETFAVTSVEKCYSFKDFTVASGNQYYATYIDCGALYNKSLTKLIKSPSRNTYQCEQSTMPTTLTEIGDYAYSDMRGYNRAIEIPVGVTKIGTSGSSMYGHVFENSTALRGVSIPSTVTSANYHSAFNGCIDLRRILLNSQQGVNNTTDVNTFTNVPPSLEIFVPSWWESDMVPYTSPYWNNYSISYGSYDAVIDGIPYIMPYDDTAFLVYGKNIWYIDEDLSMELSGSIIIPETIYRHGTEHKVYVRDYAFKGNTRITSVTINGQLQGKEIFYNCTGLTNVKFNTKWSAESYIGQNCFRNTRIQNADLPYGIQEIHAQAFADNPSLKRINLPSSSNGNVAGNFVRNCPALQSINLNLTSTSLMFTNYWGNVSDVDPGSSNGGCFYNVPRTCKVYVPVGSRNTFLGAKTSNGYYPWRYFNSIGAGASDWQDLTVINENSDGSFNAKQVYIPDNAIQYFTISDNTYKSDSFARRYYIKELSDSCFAGASQLTGVKITWSDNILKKIPDYAFASCTGLTTFKWPDKLCKLSYIGKGAFANTSIQGVVDLTMCNDTKLDIQDYAFSNTPYVTHFKLPANVARIGESAMMEVSGAALTDVTCLATNPPTNLGPNVWNYNLQSGQTLHVPQGCVNKYKAAAQWKNFGNIVDAIPGDVNGDGHVNSVDVTALYNYLLNGDSSELVNGDQDGDGIITSVDITIVYNILLGN